jgi:hypothetical protein
MMVALLALVGGSAWAAGGGTGGATAGVTSGVHGATAPASNATTAAPLPPPPPSSVNPTVSSQNTIPPTPAPATAGLPSPSSTGALPSSQGLPAATTNELRPSPSLNAAQVADVQATLAAGGLYRGPIDGNMSGSLRASIREFQQIAALPQTGDLDAATMAQLTRSNATGGSGSNGTTSTSGNLSTSQPFTTVLTTIPGTPTTTTQPPTGTIFSQPFQLSAPANTSPTPPAGMFIQP